MSWRPLVGDDYKSCWCVPCTGGRDVAGIWAHWEREDGFTVCGEFHKPNEFSVHAPPTRGGKEPK